MCPIELIVRIKKDVSQALAVSVSIAGTPLGWQLSRARQNNSSFHSNFLSGLSSPPSCGDGYCYDAGSVSGPGTSTCQGRSQKLKILGKEKFNGNIPEKS